MELTRCIANDPWVSSVKSELSRLGYSRLLTMRSEPIEVHAEVPEVICVSSAELQWWEAIPGGLEASSVRSSFAIGGSGKREAGRPPYCSIAAGLASLGRTFFPCPLTKCHDPELETSTEQMQQPETRCLIRVTVPMNGWFSSSARRANTEQDI